jgi:hypothetical protein
MTSVSTYLASAKKRDVKSLAKYATKPPKPSVLEMKINTLSCALKAA